MILRGLLGELFSRSGSSMFPSVRAKTVKKDFPLYCSETEESSEVQVTWGGFTSEMRDV